MGWPDLVRKYVWNEEKTPYLTPPGKLSPAQARNELFAYTWLLGTIFGVLTIVALGRRRPYGDGVAFAIAAYAFSVLCGALILGLTRRVAAARYCLTAPVALALIVAAGALGPYAGALGTLLLLVVMLAWLRYAVRVVAVAQALGRTEDQGRT